MNKDRKKWVILTPGFAASETDSTCIPMQQSFVQKIKEIYPELNIIILSFEYPFTKKEYTYHGIPVIPFSGKNKGGIFKLFLRQRVYRMLKEIRATSGIKGILSFWYGECAMVGKRFADKYGIKHYCWMWGQDARKSNKYIRNIKLDAEELIAFSEFLQDEFEKNHGARPQHVIPPGIDSHQFSQEIIQKDIDVFGAGSLIPLKQYEIFIEVVAELKKQIPGIKAVLAGDGPEKNRLETLISKYRLESTITLAGELPHPEVLQHMQRSKIFLHPSSFEGFGVVNIEALYSGCHVISFCQPLKRKIEQWHIVKTKEEMFQKANSLLQSRLIKFEKVVVNTIEETTKSVIGLFGTT